MDLARLIQATLSRVHEREGYVSRCAFAGSTSSTCWRARQPKLLPVRRLSDDGRKAWQEVIEHGWEGLVAKGPASRYVAGRSLSWLKVKQPKYRWGERVWAPKG